MKKEWVQFCVSAFVVVLFIANGGIPVNAVQAAEFQDWASTDIGNPGVEGATDINGDIVSISASGVDIFGTSDQFRYFQKDMSGDCEFIVHVDSHEALVNWAKAGIMFRESLDAGSKNVLLAVSGHKITLQNRPETDGETIPQTALDIIAPRWLKLARVGEEFSAFYSDDGSAWTLHATATVPFLNDYHVGLAVTSHVDSSLSVSVFSGISAEAIDASEFHDWISADIGEPLVAGATGLSCDCITMKASGADIWSSNDQCRYFYNEMGGDCDVVVRVDSLEATHGWTKAGIMFRENLDSNSKNVFLGFTTQKITLQQRQENGDEECTSQTAADIIAPRWLKLSRVGDEFSAYYSDDGAEWTFHASTTVDFSYDYFAGLAATSHVDSVLGTAIFSELSIETNPISVDEDFQDLPAEFLVGRNFPNPFNPHTNLQYEIPKPGNVVITIHNALGQKVRKSDMGHQEQGVHSIVFDAGELTSGLYFYTIDAGYSSVTEKMLLMK